MKTSSLLLAIMLLAFRCQAQTYTYKPIGFDTSCYWQSMYSSTQSPYFCQGERLSTVIGDTMIGMHKYHKVLTYTTAFTQTSSTGHFFCFSELNLVEIRYFREDTVTKKVYDSSGAIVLDFDLDVGDTINYSPFVPVPVTVDSITIRNINGVDRRLQWGTITPMLPKMTYHTIEGIGANVNFPVGGIGEWCLPAYWLRCYSKGGQMLYSDGSVSSCTKKPMIKVATGPDPRLNHLSVTISGHELKVLNAQALPLTAQLYDMLGRLVCSYTITSTAPVLLDLTPGSYVLKLSRENETAAFRVQIM